MFHTSFTLLSLISCCMFSFSICSGTEKEEMNKLSDFWKPQEWSTLISHVCLLAWKESHRRMKSCNYRTELIIKGTSSTTETSIYIRRLSLNQTFVACGLATWVWWPDGGPLKEDISTVLANFGSVLWYWLELLPRVECHPRKWEYRHRIEEA